MTIRCGIDLGTTYSGIAWYDAYNSRVQTIDLDSADGAPIIRSVVYYQGGGNPPVIGEAAWNAMRQHPDRVIVGVKRSMGTGYRSPPMDGVEYTAPQVSAEILKTLARDAEKHFGEEIKEVIITVPAHFSDGERAATMEAGQLAGLKVIQLLSEPQAAALAFAVEKSTNLADKALLVYDLGGGTFDVTLIRAKTAPDASNALQLEIETLVKEGNAHLGGLDWDKALCDIVAEKAANIYGVDVQQDPSNQAVLLDRCEKAKRDLSRVASVSIVVDAAGHQVEISISEFEERTRSFVVETQVQLEKVLGDARQYLLGDGEKALDEADRDRLTKERIEVLLAGGSSRMPMVRKMIQGVMGKPALQYKNPELLVSMGAAYWAHLISGESIVVPRTVPGGDGTRRTEVKGRITDVSITAIGVEVTRADDKGGLAKFNSVIIPSGAPYEKEFKKMFQTTEDNMTEIPVVLYEGDSHDLDQCKPLLDFVITGLPPNRRKGQLVDVTLKLDASGIISGSAVDVGSRQSIPIIVDRKAAQSR